jgi:hypothetical protein
MVNRALILDYIAMSLLKRYSYMLFPHKVVPKVQKSSNPEGILDFEIPSYLMFIHFTRQHQLQSRRKIDVCTEYLFRISNNFYVKKSFAMNKR